MTPNHLIIERIFTYAMEAYNVTLKQLMAKRCYVLGVYQARRLVLRLLYDMEVSFEWITSIVGISYANFKKHIAETVRLMQQDLNFRTLINGFTNR